MARDFPSGRHPFDRFRVNPQMASRLFAGHWLLELSLRNCLPRAAHKGTSNLGPQTDVVLIATYKSLRGVSNTSSFHRHIEPIYLNISNASSATHAPSEYPSSLVVFCYRLVESEQVPSGSDTGPRRHIRTDRTNQIPFSAKRCAPRGLLLSRVSAALR
jgi:hypothetical protein